MIEQKISEVNRPDQTCGDWGKYHKIKYKTSKSTLIITDKKKVQTIISANCEERISGVLLCSNESC